MTSNLIFDVIEMDRADVVIVGGGSTGANIAFHLAKAGQKNIVLLEKDFLAFGATGRSAAIVRCHYPHRETSKLALKSLEFFQSFDKEVGGHSGFTRTGLLVLVGINDAANLKGTVAMQNDVGVNVDVVSNDEIRRIEPRLALDGIAIGAWEPAAGYADSSSFVTSLASRSEKMGVKILQKTKLTGIETSGGKIVRVKTDKDNIETPKVVCATGSWSQQIGDMISVKFPLKLRRSKLAVFKRPADFGASHPIVFDVPQDSYFRPDGQRTIVGGAAPTSPEGRANLNPDRFGESVESGEALKFANDAVLRFPAFANAVQVGGWAGISDDGLDGYPILSELPTIDGFFCAFGMSGHGFKLSPMIGKAMADLVMSGKSKEFNMEEYRYSRFEESKPIEVPLEYSWGVGPLESKKAT